MFKNLKIGFHLALGFGAVLVFMIVIIVLSFKSMGKIYADLERIVNEENISTAIANKMVDYVRENQIYLRNIMINNDDAYKETMNANIVKVRDLYDDEMKKYEAMVIEKNDEIAMGILTKIKTIGEEYRKCRETILALDKEGKSDQATEILVKTGFPLAEQWVDDLHVLVQNEDNTTLLSYNQAQDTYQGARTYTTVIGLIMIAMSVVIIILLTFSITKPIRISVDVAKKIASNDLSVNLNIEKRGDEIGELMEAFNKMIESLRAQVKAILEGVNVLSSSSSEILASTTQIAAGTAETASSISETTATVEEVRQGAQLSSEKAKNVVDNAERTMQETESGQKAIEETINVMGHISNQMESIANTIVSLSGQSQLIGGIIASVNEIADQSNLLAVNAAIEASKAGEQGKGFTVVAHEIKSLAEQSKKATSQVRTILSDIQKATSAAVMATEQGSKAVEAGVKQSKQAGETIRLLAENSEEALLSSTQISASSQQQLVGMNQIGQAMGNIKQAGIENAASMKQTEQTVKELNKLGLQLKELVGQYKL